MICTECGLVVGDRVIDVGSEWRTFSNDKESKDMCRVGDVENRLLSGSDLSTIIGPSGRGRSQTPDKKQTTLARIFSSSRWWR